MKLEWLLGAAVAFPFAAACIVWLIGRVNKTARDVAVITVTAIEAVLALLIAVLGAKGGLSLDISGWSLGGLHLTADGFRGLYAAIAAGMWLSTTAFSKEYFSTHYHNRNRYYFFLLLTLGATVGVFLAADLMTLLVFFEIMSFTSFVWVAQDERAVSLRAADTYLAVAVIGGLLVLMGLFLLYHETGTLLLTELAGATALADSKRVFAAGVLILFGFGAKAGMFPLHIWLPKAHPVAPAPASALLSGILTKTGVFGILAAANTVFAQSERWGRLVLILGVITMVGGAVLALLSVDLKRTLACSSMSQIGFILVAVGLMPLAEGARELAMRGAVLHMVNHSLFKLVLFLAAGAVYMNLHELDLNKIRGFGRGKPLLTAAFLLGGLGLTGVPLFSGYISKTLIHEAIVACAASLSGGAAVTMKLIEILFLCSGGLTVAYMTKLFVALFIEKPDPAAAAQWPKKRCMNALSALALCVPAVLIAVLGLFPNALMGRLTQISASFFGLSGVQESVAFFSWGSLKGALISVAIGAAVYALVCRPLLMKTDETGRRVYVNRLPAKLDLENSLYRPVLLQFLPWVLGNFSALFGENRILRPLCAGVMKVLAVAARAVCDLFDGFVRVCCGVIRLIGKRPGEPPVGTRFTYALGRTADRLSVARAHAKGEPEPAAPHYEVSFAEESGLLKKTTHKILRSYSFSMLMACAGLLVALLILLFVR